MKNLRFIITFALALTCFARSGRAGAPATAALYIYTTGSGEFSPFQSGQLINVGQNCALTATADPGYEFNNWEMIGVYTLEQFTVDAHGNPLPPVFSQVVTHYQDYFYTPTVYFTMQADSLVEDVPGQEIVTGNWGWQANFTPTPEPSTLGLIACGLTVIFFRAAKR